MCGVKGAVERLSLLCFHLKRFNLHSPHVLFPIRIRIFNLFKYSVTMTTNSSLGVGFELLHYVRHHFVGEANKVTPSGRLQSCVLVVLTDALVLSSHRGGVHRYISLHDLESITQLPRGRVLFHVRSAHNVLLSIPGYTKVVAVLVQLHAGLKAASLPVATSETVPALPSLNLRPSPQFVSTVPKAVFQAIRLAGVAQARESVSDARKSLQGGALAKPAVVKADPALNLEPVSADTNAMVGKDSSISRPQVFSNSPGDYINQNQGADVTPPPPPPVLRGDSSVEDTGSTHPLTFSTWTEQSAAKNLRPSDMDDRLHRRMDRVEKTDRKT